ncbi:STAS domain-containing protein [Mycolicibacterium sediminis]|uniref:Sulfate transporter n=1 Tax=Mycolicibacterium sediminis TaxID=1286180 RepID=A0A7I7QNQ4_9MYCO|nr:STAS domain-containing protein [Mycolicibacterium sediminis]BBY27993.1 sulfate transporter [Mycolicibacterium sediminis]
MTRPDDADLLRIDQHVAPGHTALLMSGVLDGVTYRTARDAILKAAVDGPANLVMDVTDVVAPRPSAWAVFTSARWLTNQWPDVPMGISCAHASGRRTLARNGIARYVPVFRDVDAAVAALTREHPGVRRRMRHEWPATSSSVPAAREFVAHWLTAWGSADMVATATVVATVLVDNVLRHTDSRPDLRLELNRANVTVAVSDGNSAAAAVREDAEAAGRLSELTIVGVLTLAWGNTPIDGGKTVWAVMGPQNRL